MKEFLKLILISFLFGVFSIHHSFSQSINAGVPILEETIRRQQILGKLDRNYSFFVRPLVLNDELLDSLGDLKSPYFSDIYRSKKSYFGLTPVISTTTYNSSRPYGWGNKGLLPNVGFQSYLSAGFAGKFRFLKFQFQPEFVYAENRPFEGFSSEFSSSVIRSRFFYWNNGDNPERFGDQPINRLWWGQSEFLLSFGPVDMGISTRSIWWGPGRYNSLTFSDNAESFPHLTLQTNRPIKTPIGHFEGQILIGRLENSLLEPSQSDSLNRRLFRRFDGDWRYLNAMHLTYQPSFLQGLFLGFSRTFQQYNQFRGNTFNDWFPIFEVFQKKSLFTNGNSVQYDSRGQDQQVVVSFRFLSPKGRFEIYSEYGRRDHAFDWRDFIMNPEHARAFLLGFQKLVPLEKPESYLQISGELTHQQESVNRYIRYRGLIGNQTWHTHGLARGFVNRGESLGVGQGVGSNVQTLEISKVERFNKLGLLFERIENHQDFFYRAFGQSSEKSPWVDYSLALLWDQQWNKLLFSSKVQWVKAYNYQWQSSGISSVDFPPSSSKNALFVELSLIYQISKN
ncbi:MAG: Capsule assembly protein Wzi [Algoriphagus marincola HL-49]|uniref:Capsule assembly protein Wzi n=1 Tax=Algoriphagus marincola HL-49 TaxID=1305737 RepID=A0A0P7XZD9_9BACT|nr:MAG: Capsule assembly protein Wzi [Algoriphagus marincola HL-49]